MSRAKPKWTAEPARAELLALYKELDALLLPFGCGRSAECCDFANTGREPMPTTVELAEVLWAARAKGLSASKTRLPIAGESARRCAMLDEAGRCRIYESRPLGCRTFFCARMTGPGKLPRDEIQRISRAVTDLSERAFRRDPLPRPLARALETLAGADPLEALAKSR